MDYSLKSWTLKGNRSQGCGSKKGSSDFVPGVETRLGGSTLQEVPVEDEQSKQQSATAQCDGNQGSRAQSRKRVFQQDRGQYAAAERKRQQKPEPLFQEQAEFGGGLRLFHRGTGLEGLPSIGIA